MGECIYRHIMKQIESEQQVMVEVGDGTITHSVIWLHGLGADGYDFAAIVDQLNLGEFNVRFIFPHAEQNPVTINQGFVMRSWYDIRSPDIASDQDEQGIRQSQQRINGLIEEQIAQGITSENIVLAGFSQGGVIALQTALRFPHKLAGVMALSTYLALADSLAAEKTAVNQTIPIFLAHGKQDPVIQIQWAYQTHSALIREGYQVDWHEYVGMPHSVSAEEIEDINR